MKFKNKAKHIEIIQLPSDTNGALGSFRTGLLAIYNRARGNPERMLLLLQTLKFVVANIENDIVKTRKPTPNKETI